MRNEAKHTEAATAAPGNRALSWLGAGSGLVGAVSLAMPAFDPRQLLGESVWLKPAKFGVSIAIVAFTLSLLLRAIPVPEKPRRRAVGAIVALLALELVIITGQAVRGRASHYNVSTLLDAVLFQIMGAGITLATVAVAYLGYRAFRIRFEDRALGWGIRLGFVLMVMGSLVAFLMTQPTSDQLARMQAGELPARIGAHTVQAEDGGPGLPVTRWSTRGGDLRVPHFIGLHALQIMPLAGFALGRRKRLGARRAERLTLVAGFGYFGVLMTTLVQALRGQPVLAPDAITLMMLGLFALTTAALAALALAPSRADHGLRSAAHA